MNILSRRTRVTNAQIVRGAQLQETFEPRAGMLRTLAFIAVWQQHRQPRRLLPLVFAGGDVLVDDRLRDVVEISKLSFPQHERVRSDYRIAVLESEHAGFGKRTIESFKTSAGCSFRVHFRH